jgi:hypothetical protein
MEDYHNFGKIMLNRRGGIKPAMISFLSGPSIAIKHFPKSCKTFIKFADQRDHQDVLYRCKQTGRAGIYAWDIANLQELSFYGDF